MRPSGGWADLWRLAAGEAPVEGDLDESSDQDNTDRDSSCSENQRRAKPAPRSDSWSELCQIARGSSDDAERDVRQSRVGSTVSGNESRGGSSEVHDIPFNARADDVAAESDQWHPRMTNARDVYPNLTTAGPKQENPSALTVAPEDAEMDACEYVGRDIDINADTFAPRTGGPVLVGPEGANDAACQEHSRDLQLPIFEEAQAAQDDSLAANTFEPFDRDTFAQREHVLEGCGTCILDDEVQEWNVDESHVPMRMDRQRTPCQSDTVLEEAQTLQGEPLAANTVEPFGMDTIAQSDHVLEVRGTCILDDEAQELNSDVSHVSLRIDRQRTPCQNDIDQGSSERNEVSMTPSSQKPNDMSLSQFEDPLLSESTLMFPKKEDEMSYRTHSKENDEDPNCSLTMLDISGLTRTPLVSPITRQVSPSMLVEEAVGPQKDVNEICWPKNQSFATPFDVSTSKAPHGLTLESSDLVVGQDSRHERSLGARPAAFTTTMLQQESIEKSGASEKLTTVEANEAASCRKYTVGQLQPASIEHSTPSEPVPHATIRHATMTETPLRSCSHLSGEQRRELPPQYPVPAHRQIPDVSCSGQPKTSLVPPRIAISPTRLPPPTLNSSGSRSTLAGTSPLRDSSPLRSSESVEHPSINTDRKPVLRCWAALAGGPKEAVRGPLVFVEANSCGDQAFSSADVQGQVVLMFYSSCTELSKQAENAASGAASGIIVAGCPAPSGASGAKFPTSVAPLALPAALVSSADGMALASRARELGTLGTGGQLQLFVKLAPANIGAEAVPAEQCSEAKTVAYVYERSSTQLASSVGVPLAVPSPVWPQASPPPAWPSFMTSLSGSSHKGATPSLWSAIAPAPRATVGAVTRSASPRRQNTMIAPPMRTQRSQTPRRAGPSRWASPTGCRVAARDLSPMRDLHVQGNRGIPHPSAMPPLVSSGVPRHAFAWRPLESVSPVLTRSRSPQEVRPSRHDTAGSLRVVSNSVSRSASPHPRCNTPLATCAGLNIYKKSNQPNVPLDGLVSTGGKRAMPVAKLSRTASAGGRLEQHPNSLVTNVSSNYMNSSVVRATSQPCQHDVARVTDRLSSTWNAGSKAPLLHNRAIHSNGSVRHERQQLRDRGKGSNVDMGKAASSTKCVGQKRVTRPNNIACSNLKKAVGVNIVEKPGVNESTARSVVPPKVLRAASTGISAKSLLEGHKRGPFPSVCRRVQSSGNLSTTVAL